jgi:hypothetical protein
MRSAPWWVQGLVAGALWGTFMWVFAWGDPPHGQTPASVAIAVLLPLLFGLLMGLVFKRMRRGIDDAVDGRVPKDRLRSVGRAAVKGPVPGDPAEREVAARLNAVWLRQYERQRWWGLPFLLAMSALDVYLAVTHSWWYALALVGFLVLAMSWLVNLHRLRRQSELLRD